jgi:predicted transcriptional regulator
VLSEDSRMLLRIICDAKPKTLTELAALSGRQVPNLSCTLRITTIQQTCYRELGT